MSLTLKSFRISHHFLSGLPCGSCFTPPASFFSFLKKWWSFDYHSQSLFLAALAALYLHWSVSEWVTHDYRSTWQCTSGQITSNFLTQASWRLYRIRQPPTSLCTTSNFLTNAKVIISDMVIIHGHDDHHGWDSHHGQNSHQGQGGQPSQDSHHGRDVIMVVMLIMIDMVIVVAWLSWSWSSW